MSRLLMLPLATTSTLFPYTTLFRSQRVARPFDRQVYRHRMVLPVHPVRGRAQPRDSRSQIRHVLIASGVVDAQDIVALQSRSEEHTSELQSQFHLVCRLLLEKKKRK